MNILKECLVSELSFGSRRVCLVSIYRTPNQSSNKYDTFLLNFEQLLTYLKSIKPHVLLVTGDFNVRFSSWCSDDFDTIEGMRLESIIFYCGLYQDYSNLKLFDDGTSLFSENCDSLDTANILNNDLRKIREWAEQWKMVFNLQSFS